MKSVGIIAWVAWVASAVLWAEEIPQTPAAQEPVAEEKQAQGLEVKKEKAPEALELQKEHMAAEEMLTLRKQLEERDALVRKLKGHLESALGRLNRVQSPMSAPSSSLAALNAARAKLEEQNNVLKARQDELEKQIAELTREKQILDLENRQMFQAINGRPRDGRVAEEPREKNKATGTKRNLVLGD